MRTTASATTAGAMLADATAATVIAAAESRAMNFAAALSRH
jgi:hypothetical protein